MALCLNYNEHHILNFQQDAMNWNFGLPLLRGEQHVLYEGQLKMEEGCVLMLDSQGEHWFLPKSFKHPLLTLVIPQV